MIEKHNHLKKIDFLRGIAIILVFLYHAQFSLFPDYLVTSYKSGVIDINNINGLIKNFFPTAYGWSGVNLFLVISGFLIHLGYLKNENDFKISVFFSKRFWRIYPPYLLALLFFCFATNGFYIYLFTLNGLLDFVLHVLFLHNLYEPTHFGINGAFWSLALEMQLYLIYPVLLFIRKKVGIEKTFLYVIGLAILSHILGALLHLNKYVAFEHSIFRLWFVWVAGAYFAEVYFNKKTLIKKNAGLVTFISFVLLLGSGYFLITSYLSVYIATFAWVFFLDWFLKTESITLNHFSAKSIITIGLCSYSIYLIHAPFLTPMLDFFAIVETRHYDLKLLKIIPTFAVVFLISYSLYILVELPSVQFGNKLRDRFRKKNNLD